MRPRSLVSDAAVVVPRRDAHALAAGEPRYPRGVGRSCPLEEASSSPARFARPSVGNAHGQRPRQATTRAGGALLGVAAGAQRSSAFVRRLSRRARARLFVRAGPGRVRRAIWHRFGTWLRGRAPVLATVHAD